MSNRLSELWRRWAQSGPAAPQAAWQPAPSLADAASPWLAAYDRLGIPRSLRYPQTTLGRLLDQTASRYGNVPALIYGELSWSYAQLLDQVNRLAGGLAQMGVQRGDRVLMTLPNCPEFLTAFFAIQKLGAIVVNAGPLLGTDDMRRLVELARPRLIIGLDLQAGMLSHAGGEQQPVPRLCVSLSGYQTMWKRLGYHYKLWQAHRHERNGRCEMMLDDLLQTAPARPPTVAPEPDDLAVLQPTGGTTGTLKVAMLTHRNLLSNAVQISAWGRLRFGQEAVLGILPMFHAYGLTMAVIGPVYSAGTILPLTRFRVQQVLDTIERHHCSVLPLVPAILHAICTELEQRPRPALCHAMRHSVVISGAAPLPTPLAQRFAALTGLTIMQGYGLTEASPVTHSNPLSETRAESVGLPLPDTHVRVVDLQNPDKDAPRGEAGELLISGPQVFQGYYEDPEQTARVLSRDARGRRWLHTGDVVRMDGDGFFYIIDRQKDMINRGGEKVWPARVERVLRLHSAVADAAVLGRPDPTHGEAVAALIVAAPDFHDPNGCIRELRALCREHLGPHEIPESFEFVDQIPRSALGKLLRFQLRSKPADPATAQGAS